MHVSASQRAVSLKFRYVHTTSHADVAAATVAQIANGLKPYWPIAFEVGKSLRFQAGRFARCAAEGARPGMAAAAWRKKLRSSTVRVDLKQSWSSFKVSRRRPNE